MVIRKGGKVATIPLAPRTVRAIDLAIGERQTDPYSRPPTGRGWTDTAPRGSSAALPGRPLRMALTLGLGKAIIVAHKAASIGTARDLRMYYSSSLIQVLGDGATVSVSGVCPMSAAPGQTPGPRRARATGTHVLAQSVPGRVAPMADQPGATP